MKNKQIKYTKVLRSYKRRARKNGLKNNLINSLKKNINLLFEFIKNKAESFFVRHNLTS